MTDFRDRGMGWKPSPPDFRDYKVSVPENVELPGGVDLRQSGFLPSVWDQGQLGSCVAHGVGAAYSFDQAKQGGAQDYLGSRLYVYYNGRSLEGHITEDSGLYIRDGVKVLGLLGFPPESDWGYDINRFTEKPPQQAYDDGDQRQAIVYGSVDQNETAIKSVLASGYPVVIGFTVYDSFYDAGSNGGFVPMPSQNESVAGGHCADVVGYGAKYWICRNSWSDQWGDKGYFYMPIPYLLNPDLADDFWVVKSVEAPGPTPVPPTPTTDFVKLATDTANAFHDLAPAGDLVFVRDIVRNGKLVEKVWKQSGFEIGVKSLHP